MKALKRQAKYGHKLQTHQLTLKIFALRAGGNPIKAPSLAHRHLQQEAESRVKSSSPIYLR